LTDKNIKQVKEFLEARGIKTTILSFKETTRTSELAAKAIGCEVAQIAKSLVFITDEKAAVLVIASGKSRVDTRKLAKKLEASEVKIADAKTVKEVTGFPIGGVPPVAHDKPLRTFIDAHLMSFPVVYAAAGTPNAIIGISPEDLKNVTSAEVADVFE